MVMIAERRLNVPIAGAFIAWLADIDAPSAFHDFKIECGLVSISRHSQPPPTRRAAAKTAACIVRRSAQFVVSSIRRSVEIDWYHGGPGIDPLPLRAAGCRSQWA